MTFQDYKLPGKQPGGYRDQREINIMVGNALRKGYVDQQWYPYYCKLAQSITFVQWQTALVDAELGKNPSKLFRHIIVGLATKAR